MRVVICSIVGIPIAVAAGIAVYSVNVPLARLAGWREVAWITGGLALYIPLHAFRKPERLYVWGHELSHLLLAKLCFRKVHAFEIAGRGSGKVVIDGTNAAIDLAPYAIPLPVVATAMLALLARHFSPFVAPAYLVLLGFLGGMHLLFTVEGFLDAQPDLTRGGRFFSLGLTVLGLALAAPALVAPGLERGFAEIPAAYAEWTRAFAAAAGDLLLRGRDLLNV